MKRTVLLVVTLIASTTVIAARTEAAPIARTARACASYSYVSGPYRFVVGSIRARGLNCVQARRLIHRYDAKRSKGHYQVGSKISVAPWACYVFRPFDPTQVNGLCERSGHQRLSWVETSGGDTALLSSLRMAAK